MPKISADFTAILEEAFRAEVAAAFRPVLLSGGATLVVLIMGGILIHRLLKMLAVTVPRKALLLIVIVYGGALFFHYQRIQAAQTIRTLALAEIPGKAQQASALVRRLLEDSTGTAVVTESGTYLAVAGDQVFLPTPVAEALQKKLEEQNLRFP